MICEKTVIKSAKSIISIVVAILMVMCVAPFSVSAEEISIAKEKLSVTVDTDRDDYTANGTVKVTVNVENIGDSIVTGVHSAAEIAGFKVVESTASSVTLGEIGPGETKSFTFSAIPSYKNSDFGIFAKIVLFFRNLFVKTKDFPLTGIQNKYKSIGNCEFMLSGVRFSVSAYAVAGGERYSDPGII